MRDDSVVAYNAIYYQTMLSWHVSVHSGEIRSK